jgi:hypothetical protein
MHLIVAWLDLLFDGWGHNYIKNSFFHCRRHAHFKNSLRLRHGTFENLVISFKSLTLVNGNRVTLSWAKNWNRLLFSIVQLIELVFCNLRSHKVLLSFLVFYILFKRFGYCFCSWPPPGLLVIKCDPSTAALLQQIHLHQLVKQRNKETSDFVVNQALTLSAFERLVSFSE